MNLQHDSFISYRRDGGSDIARILQVELSSKHGRKPFLDLKDLTRQGGTFDEKLLESIKNTDNFILVLSPNALERCHNDNDWVRQEIAHAISSNKNIIPVELEGFQEPKTGVPNDIQGVLRIQRVKYDRFYHDAAIELISQRFLATGDRSGSGAYEGTSVNANERADHFLARAKEGLSSEDYVGALRYLQMAILLKESAESHFFAGMALAAVFEPPSHIKREFDRCLELDSKFEDAATALRVLDDLAPVNALTSELNRKTLWSKLSSRLQSRLANPIPRPLLHVITPPWARNWWIPFWITLVASVLGLTSALRVGSGDDLRLYATLLKFTYFCSALFCLNSCANIFGSVYFSLRHLAAAKARNGFEEWFSDWMGRIFGVIPNGQRTTASLSSNRLPGPFAITFSVAVILTMIAPFFIIFEDQTAYISSIRWFEFLIANLAGVFVAPTLLLSFAFFKDCSRMPMRPAIAAADLDMLERLSNALIAGVASAVLCFVLVSAWGLIEYNSNKLQLGFYLVTLAVGMSWSALAPVYFSRAISKSRDAVLAQYGDHIEEALHQFVSDPTEKTLVKYKWLLDHQKYLDGIRASLLTSRALCILLSLNLLIIAVAYSYPDLKWDASPYEILKTLLRNG